MPESNMIDLSKVIGVYGLCNTGAVLVHAIDYPEDKVLASSTPMVRHRAVCWSTPTF